MKNYRLLDACENCKHVFTKSDHDSEDYYYCALNAGKRPKCGSGFMDESHGCHLPVEQRREAWRKGDRLWEDWAKGREVGPRGKCDNWAGE